jgi:hypothetical protein
VSVEGDSGSVVQWNEESDQEKKDACSFLSAIVCGDSFVVVVGRRERSGKKRRRKQGRAFNLESKIPIIYEKDPIPRERDVRAECDTTLMKQQDKRNR